MNNLVSRRLPACLRSSVLFLALALAGCGVSSATVGSGAQSSTTSSPAVKTTPTATTQGHIPSSTSELACELDVTVRPIDSMGETLHCTVAHMPSSQTTFVLHYSVSENAGKSIVVPPVCRGTLSGGAGTCTAIFTSPLPQLLTRGVVSGSTQPNNYPLGPIMPKQVAGGTPVGTPPPFQPHG